MASLFGRKERFSRNKTKRGDRLVLSSFLSTFREHLFVFFLARAFSVGTLEPCEAAQALKEKFGLTGILEASQCSLFCGWTEAN